MSSEHAASSQGRFRILVVDDDRSSAFLMSKLLAFLGPIDVETVYDGPSALERADLFHPHLLVVDITMPGMDGLTVARRLRANSNCRESILVAFTALDRQVDRRRIRDAGFDEQLAKPLNLESLEKVLDRYLFYPCAH